MATPLRPRTLSGAASVSDGSVTIVLLDDHDLVRQGVANLINAQSDMTVVGHAGTANDVLALIEQNQPDVAVLDVRLQESSGIEVCRQVTANMPDVRCIMLTSIDDDRTIVESAKAGAVALVLKRARGEELLEAIRRVTSGARLLDSAAVRGARERLHLSEDGLVDDLTPQEQRLFAMLGEGFSNRQIADEMNLTEKTVKNYVSNVLAKLGMVRRTQAAALAARLDERRHLT